jgi:hypothetical protein
MEVVAQDRFDRADNAAALGSSDGVPYSVSGTWGISGQRAYIATYSGTAVALRAGHPAARVGDVRSRIFAIRTEDGINGGVAFMGADTNNYLWADVSHQVGALNRIRIVKIVAGAGTVLASATPSDSTFGTDVALRVSYNGITGVIAASAGAAVISHTLSGGDLTGFGANTMFGLRLDDNRLRADDLQLLVADRRFHPRRLSSPRALRPAR